MNRCSNVTSACLISRAKQKAITLQSRSSIIPRFLSSSLGHPMSSGVSSSGPALWICSSVMYMSTETLKLCRAVGLHDWSKKKKQQKPCVIQKELYCRRGDLEFSTIFANFSSGDHIFCQVWFPSLSNTCSNQSVSHNSKTYKLVHLTKYRVVSADMAD